MRQHSKGTYLLPKLWRKAEAVRSVVQVWCANPARRATASPAGAEKIFPIFNLSDWFSPILSLFRTETLFGSRSLIRLLPARGEERRDPRWGCPREATYLGVSVVLSGAAGDPGSPAARGSGAGGARGRAGMMLRRSRAALAPFPPPAGSGGVEAAFWLPPAWSTVNNVPAVSADKPSLMRLQQKHSNMHYRTSAGIFIFFF